MLWQIDFWDWWIFAVLLLIIEILAPGFVALWMAIAAITTGFVLLLMPDMNWQIQLLIFAVLSVIVILIWRRYYKKNPIQSDEPNLNRRGEQYIGRLVTLQTPIVDGIGKIRLDDSTWKVEGPDCPAGKKVRIEALNNVVFSVKPEDFP